ncbi:hypothetical protein ABK040_012402 [Willaertia magna]
MNKNPPSLLIYKSSPFKLSLITRESKEGSEGNGEDRTMKNGLLLKGEVSYEEEDYQSKREKAEEMIKRSEERKLKKRYEKEFQLTKVEEEKVRAFENYEWQQKEELTRTLNTVGKIYRIRKERKLNLLKKLFNLHMKQKANELAFEERQKEKGISYEEISLMAKKETRNRILQTVNSHRDEVKYDFIEKLMQFTKIPIEQEIKEMNETIFSYVEPKIIKYKNNMNDTQNSHKLLMDKFKKEMMTDLRKSVKEKFDKKLESDHEEKANECIKAKEELSFSEIDDFIDAEVEDYETNIFASDVEMERIRNILEEKETRRLSNLRHHQQRIAPYLSHIEKLNEKSKLLENSIKKLLLEREKMKTSEEKFINSCGGITLVELQEQTSENKKEIPNCKDLKITLEREVNEVTGELCKYQKQAEEILHTVAMTEKDTLEIENLIIKTDEEFSRRERVIKELQSKTRKESDLVEANDRIKVAKQTSIDCIQLVSSLFKNQMERNYETLQKYIEMLAFLQGFSKKDTRVGIDSSSFSNLTEEYNKRLSAWKEKNLQFSDNLFNGISPEILRKKITLHMTDMTKSEKYCKSLSSFFDSFCNQELSKDLEEQANEILDWVSKEDTTSTLCLIDNNLLDRWLKLKEEFSLKYNLDIKERIDLVSDSSNNTNQSQTKTRDSII